MKVVILISVIMISNSINPEAALAFAVHNDHLINLIILGSLLVDGISYIQKVLLK